MWIRKVAATRADGTVSQVDFGNGLNYVVGPSNTGKTRIAKTIAFACGADETPFTEKEEHVDAQVVFVTPRGEVTLNRSIKNKGLVSVVSTDSMIESGAYSSKRRRNKASINDVLLALLGIHATRKVAKNESYEVIAFTWNAIRHLMLVSEDQIGRPNPSILFPKSAGPVTTTQILAELLVLAQDTDFDNVESRESPKERKARRKAVKDYVNAELEAIELRVEELEKSRQQARAEGKTLDAYTQELGRTLQELEEQRDTLISQDAKTVENMGKLTQRCEQLDVLVEQRSALLSQYDSDSARLDLQVQAMKIEQSHPHPTTCQFCNSTIAAEPPSDSDIEMLNQEIARIGLLREGAASDLAVQQKRQNENQERLARERQRHDANMSTLRNRVKPDMQSVQEKLKLLAEAERLDVEMNELNVLRRRFTESLDQDSGDADNGDKFKPRNEFSEDFYYTMQENIRYILRQSNFPNPDSSTFDHDAFDIKISGYSKEQEQGKGYCAFLNTVVVLAFHRYLNGHSPHAPGFLLIDTPLHGFDEGSGVDNRDSMRIGLLNYLSDQAKDEQIIILENTEHVEGVCMDNGTNVVRFSKSCDEGRYGYLDGVYDISENGY